MKVINCSLLFTFLLGSSIVLQSQKEDFNWMLGQCGTQSDSIFSRILWTFDTQGNYHEQRTYKVDYRMEYTNASISDSLGNLLFYTNGHTIFNKDHQIMQNGDGLEAGVFANSSKETGAKLIGGALVLPWPEKQNLYLVIHVTTNGKPFLWYSLNLFTTLVDMNLDSARGDVIYKNHSVYSDSLVNGSLSACKHANGRDWWIPCFNYSGKKCFMFLFDPSGISLHHIQEIPYSFEPSGNGQAQFSPDGATYSFFHRNSQNYREFLLADFDRCTGLYSNIKFNSIPGYDFVGVAFSPDSRWLYISTAYELYQLNLKDANPFEKRFRVDSIDGFKWMPLFPCYFSFMQLAPDGKIYINNGRDPAYLSTIEKPNLQGKACDVRQHHIQITSNATLPNFPYFRLGPLEGSSCDTLARGRLPIALWKEQIDSSNKFLFRFTDESKFQINSWEWNFGDPGSMDNTSTLQNPQHVFSKSGLFNVCLIASNPIGKDTFCKTINIETVSTSSKLYPSIISIYPNPMEDYIDIKIESMTKKPITLNLVNANAQLVLKANLVSGINRLNVQDILSGIYILKLFTAENELLKELRIFKK